MIANPDGSITMALSEDSCDVTQRKDLDEVPADDVTQPEEEQNTISLSVDDLIQYAQPMPAVQLIQVQLFDRGTITECEGSVQLTSLY